MNRNKIRLIPILLAAMLCMGGCTLIKFEEQGEVKKQEEQMDTADTAVVIDLAKAVDPEELFFEESLADDQGAEIALYKAAFPYFTAETESPVVDRINEYYKTEFEQVEADKERFFAIVAEKPSPEPRRCTFDYRVLETPADYLAVVRTYEGLDTLGAQHSRSYCETFSAATGLKLSFDNIFGSNADQARELLRKALEDWSAEREYKSAWIDNAGFDLLTSDFTLDSDTLYIGLPDTAAPGGESLIELPADGFAELFSFNK